MNVEPVIKHGHILDNRDEYNTDINDLIYLLSCAVNDTIPDNKKVDNMNLSVVYHLASFHSVISTVAFALEKVIELPYDYDQSKKKAIRKLALFDIERNKILSCFTKEKIWYLPLKGIVLNDIYPQYGMREMADNDILCDPVRMQDVKIIMESLGYRCDKLGGMIHDVYSKHIISFEIHRSLFYEDRYPVFTEYYKNVKSRLLCCDNPYEFRFRLEDLYIYLLAHEYMHYVTGGTGIRSLLDIYVFLKHYSGQLDWNYLEHELKSLCLSDFEKMNRELSQKAFSGGLMSEEEKQVFMYFVSSGAHGIEEHSWKNRLSKDLSGDDSDISKRKYLFSRIFIHEEALRERYPLVYRYRILLPLLYVYRFIKAVFIKPKKIWAEYKRIKQFKYTN